MYKYIYIVRVLYILSYIYIYVHIYYVFRCVHMCYINGYFLPSLALGVQAQSVWWICHGSWRNCLRTRGQWQDAGGNWASMLLWETVHLLGIQPAGFTTNHRWSCDELLIQSSYELIPTNKKWMCSIPMKLIHFLSGSSPGVQGLNQYGNGQWSLYTSLNRQPMKPKLAPNDPLMFAADESDPFFAVLRW